MPFVSPATRFVAPDENTTKRPPEEIAIPDESVAAFASAPPPETSTLVVCTDVPAAAATDIEPMATVSTATRPAARVKRISPRLLERDDTKPGGAARGVAQAAPPAAGLPTRNRTTTPPARPASFRT